MKMNSQDSVDVTVAVSCGCVSFAAGLAVGYAYGAGYIGGGNGRTVANVTDLFIYPIKSCAGIRVSSATVTPRGLAGDRLFMVTSLSGSMMTQRVMPSMATVRPSWTEAGDLVISAPGRPDFVLEKESFQNGNKKSVTVWRHTCEDALDMGDAVAGWLSETLGKGGLRLVRMPDDHFRPVEKGYVKEDGVHQTSFSDGYPFLLTNESSLDFVREKTGCKSLAMQRFRPNIVVRGASVGPFEEDKWGELRVGRVDFEGAKRCTRCQVPRVDPVLGRADSLPNSEPTATLKAHHGNCFGINLVAHRFETAISVGDPVKVLKLKSDPEKKKNHRKGET